MSGSAAPCSHSGSTPIGMICRSSLSGRSPFAPGYGLILPYGVKATGRSGAAGTPDGKEPVDREVAAAYLRLVPEAVGQGTVSQPGHQAGAGAERDLRDALCRSARAIGATTGSPASRARASMSGEANGRLNATATGSSRAWGIWRFSPAGTPVSAKASGCEGPGWDWRRFEGTTVPQLPLKALDKGWTSISMTIHSPETFVGGLSHQGRQGVFAMILNQAIMPEKQDPPRKEELVLQRRPDPLPGFRHLLRRGAVSYPDNSLPEIPPQEREARDPPHSPSMGQTSRRSRRSERLTRPNPTGSSMFSRPATTCPPGRRSRWRAGIRRAGTSTTRRTRKGIS